MKALGITKLLDIGELKTALTRLEVPVPAPGPAEIQVKIHAACINIDDIHMAEGTFLGGVLPVKASTKKPKVCGVDAAGIVEKIGDKVTAFKPGDAVFGYCPPKGPGTWAEYTCIPQPQALKKPADYTFEAAAACAIGGKTAANAVMSAGNVSGKSCMVIGASGGIGAIILQILKKCGAHVTGVCSGRNHELVLSLGADTVIDYTQGSLADQAEGKAFDRVIDCIGGKDTEKQALKVLKRNGRFVTLCGPDKYIGDTRSGTWGMIKMMTYVSWRAFASLARGPRYIMAGISSTPEPVKDYILAHAIKPPIDRVLSFDENSVREGVAYVASHRARGKVVISVIPTDTPA